MSLATSFQCSKLKYIRRALESSFTKYFDDFLAFISHLRRNMSTCYKIDTLPRCRWVTLSNINIASSICHRKRLILEITSFLFILFICCYRLVAVTHPNCLQATLRSYVGMVTICYNHFCTKITLSHRRAFCEFDRPTH